MDFLTKLLSPPLIVVRGNTFILCGSGHEIPAWLEPDILQSSSAFVIYDPGGHLLSRYRETFTQHSFRVKILDTANLGRSANYNPFDYIRNDSGIPVLVSAFITGTNGLGKPGDMSFLKAESNLLTAIAGYVKRECFDDYDKNILSVIEFLKYSFNEELRCPIEDCSDSEYKHTIDSLLKSMEEKTPEHIAVRCFREFRHPDGFSTANVIKSCLRRFSDFDTEEARAYFSSDGLCLNHFTHR